jgi:hypothetical protein
MTWARRSIHVDETKQRPRWTGWADLLINVRFYEQIKSGKLMSSKPPPPVLLPPFPGKRVYLVQVPIRHAIDKLRWRHIVGPGPDKPEGTSGRRHVAILRITALAAQRCARVSVYHREGFEEGAQALFTLVREAQANFPNQRRSLYLDIEGHRNERR